MPKRRRVLIIVVSFAIVLAAVVFRRRTVEDDYWGRTTLVYEWGFQRAVHIDRNLDGRADIRLRYPLRRGDIGHHDRPSEIWIDDDFDGEPETLWRDGTPPVLEVMSKDGRTQVFRGAEAEIPNPRIRMRGREELGSTKTIEGDGLEQR